MVNFCCIHQCGHRSNRENNLSFFTIPKVVTNRKKIHIELSKRRRREWLASINTKNVWDAFEKDKLQNFRVCSVHFITGKSAALDDDTNPDWIPTQKMGHDKTTKQSGTRYHRKKQRESRQFEQPAVDALLSLGEEPVVSGGTINEDNGPPPLPSGLEITVIKSSDAESQTDVMQGRSECQTQTDLTSADLDVLQARSDQFCKLAGNEECGLFTETSFKDNDKKTKFYTGLPSFAILMVLVNFLRTSLPPRTSVSAFQQVLIILIKLRLAVPYEDLAYRFVVSTSTISRIINDGIDVMYKNLGGLVRWPERETLWKTMPVQFRRSFGKKVAVIIDCFEVFCNRPTSLEARAQTWSNYKHHNTVKFLIGVAPSGCISYLSTAWGGRGSDKVITLESNFFSNLLPGDIVLADRGFMIGDEAGFYGCEVQIPAFTRGKPQLSPLEVETTREIAHLRIHVERLIGCVRKRYTILDKTLPVEYLVSNENDIPKIDKIARVCCGLTNLSESLISAS